MKTPLFISNQINIHAPIDVVWNALTNPTETKKYMFGCEAVSEWTAGSTLVWNGTYEAKEMTFVIGRIVNIIPKKYLAYTTFDPNSSLPDVPENYLTVTYTLKELNDSTILEVTQGDYSLVGDGEKRYNEAFNKGEGWNPILKAIKNMLESR